LAASLATVAVIAAVVVELPTRKSHTASEGNAKIENKGVVPGEVSTPAPATAQPSGTTQPSASIAETERPLRSNGAGLVADNHAMLRDEVAGNNRLASAGRVSANAKDLAAVSAPTQPVVVTGAMYAYTVEASSAPGTRQDYLNNQFFTDGPVSVNGSQMTDLPAAPAPKSANQFQLQNSLANSSQFASLNLPTQTQQNTKVLVIRKPNNRAHFPITVLDQIQLSFRRATPAIRPNVTSAFAMGGPELNPLREKGDTGEISAAAAPPDYRGDLDRSLAFSPRAMSDKYEKKTETSAAWKVDGGKLLKFADSGAWMEAYPGSEGVDFSVVKSHGSDIWAGGGNAALLHSRDGGATWERVTLGASATGTITAIEAHGANILVKSSSGQSWSSQDGGKSWALLN
jgi:hypothetical protein